MTEKYDSGYKMPEGYLDIKQDIYVPMPPKNSYEVKPHILKVEPARPLPISPSGFEKMVEKELEQLDSDQSD